MPKTVAIISLGGTISCTPAASSTAVQPTLNAVDMLESYGLTDLHVDVKPVTWSTRDSVEITFDELIDLADEVRRQYAGGIDGVVITQGTDTVEEVSFALDLLLGADFPVVVSGAMRDPSRPGADGAANLAAAILTASHEALPELGSVVVFNDEIHLARWVRKTHTSNPAAFGSPSVGPVGWISEGRVVLVLRPRLLPHEPIRATKAHHTVPLVTAVMDGSERLLDALPQLDATGLVVDGMGGGHVKGASAEALRRVAEQIPVVYASRTGRGNVLTKTYDSPGAEIELQQFGLIPAGTLDGVKARVLLALLLKAGAHRDEIRRQFAARAFS